MCRRLRWSAAVRRAGARSAFVSGWLQITAAVAIAAGAAPIPFACGQGDSRVVVVKPTPQGQPVPVRPNEKVAAVTVVRLPGRGPVAVVRIEPMPDKADFNIITPDGVSHPFKNGPSPAPGITQTHEVQVINDAQNGDRYCIKTTYREGAREVGSAKECFPQGSQYVPDPPQPPGLMVVGIGEAPLPPEHEALVLAALGLPDGPGIEVYNVQSGDLLFMHPGAQAIVHIQGYSMRGDLNCDGYIDFFDIDAYLTALFDAAAYTAQFADCSPLLADVNDDGVVDFFDIDPFLHCLFMGC